jgi:O-antigen/teichoic acid export membrane protein
MPPEQTNLSRAATATLHPVVPTPVESANPHEKHLSTAHLLPDLKGRAVSSSFVTILAQGVQFVLMLASTMILARLLSPREFGLVAMVTTIMGFLRIFNDAGLSTATVQREGITHAQVSNLFWTNVALGGTVTLLLAVLSPLIARFYREERLVGITLALCVSFLLTSSAVQHLALLKRQMRFKIIAAIQVSATTAGILVGIFMAWRHYGYWSLVGMQLTTCLITVILAWSFSSWRPQWPKRGSGTRSLLHFGAHLTASSFLWSLASGSDGLLIGRFYGSAPLGLYNRAGVLLMRPIQQFMPAIESVFVPTLARLQSQPERYRRTILATYDVIAAASFLAGGLLFSLAHPLTLAVLGQKWEEAYPIFASFTFAAICMPVGSVSTWLLTSQGRGRDFLILSSSTSFLTIVFFLVGLPFGPVGVAISYSAFYLVVILPVGYYIAGRRGPVTAGDLWRRFFAQSPLWVVMCGVTWGMHSLVVNIAPWKQLAICTPVALLLGAGFICVYTPARCAAQSLLHILQEFKEKRKAS